MQITPEGLGCTKVGSYKYDNDTGAAGALMRLFLHMQAVQAELEKSGAATATAQRERDEARASLATMKRERDTAHGNAATATRECDSAKAAAAAADRERDAARAAATTASNERDEACKATTAMARERDEARAAADAAAHELDEARAAAAAAAAAAAGRERYVELPAIVSTPASLLEQDGVLADAATLKQDLTAAWAELERTRTSLLAGIKESARVSSALAEALEREQEARQRLAVESARMPRLHAEIAELKAQLAA